MWDEITYTFPNFNDCTVEVWEWINDFSSHSGFNYLITSGLNLIQVNKKKDPSIDGPTIECGIVAWVDDLLCTIQYMHIRVYHFAIKLLSCVFVYSSKYHNCRDWEVWKTLWASCLLLYRSGLPRVREKSGKTRFMKKSGKSQEILIWVRKFWNCPKSQVKVGKFCGTAYNVSAKICWYRFVFDYSPATWK